MCSVNTLLSLVSVLDKTTLCSFMSNSTIMLFILCQVWTGGVSQSDPLLAPHLQTLKSFHSRMLVVFLPQTARFGPFYSISVGFRSRLQTWTLFFFNQSFWQNSFSALHHFHVAWLTFSSSDKCSEFNAQPVMASCPGAQHLSVQF